tara:strand:+ start:660 stop:842 length:183 start_codon:yes stop_codon:yes gene_type:complete
MGTGASRRLILCPFLSGNGFLRGCSRKKKEKYKHELLQKIPKNVKNKISFQNYIWEINGG